MQKATISANQLVEDHSEVENKTNKYFKRAIDSQFRTLEQYIAVQRLKKQGLLCTKSPSAANQQVY